MKWRWRVCVATDRSTAAPHGLTRTHTDRHGQGVVGTPAPMWWVKVGKQSVDGQRWRVCVATDRSTAAPHGLTRTHTDRHGQGVMGAPAPMWWVKVGKQSVDGQRWRVCVATDRSTAAIGPVGQVRRLERAWLEPARWCGGRRSANGCLLVPAAYVLLVLPVLPVLLAVIRGLAACMCASVPKLFVFFVYFVVKKELFVNR